MYKSLHTLTIGSILAITSISSAPRLFAQQPQLTPDEQRAFAYHLTMPNVQKTAQVMTQAQEAGVPEPNEDNKGTDATIRELDSNPRLKPILQSVGISATDLWMTVNALFNASFMSAMPDKDIPAEAKANVQFIREHQKELEPYVKAIFKDQK